MLVDRAKGESLSIGEILDTGNLLVRDSTRRRQPSYGYGSSPEGRNSAVTDRLRGRKVPPRVVWSPDERYLLTHRLDERRVEMLHLLQGAPEGSLRPRVHSYRQALPGDAELPLAQLVVFDVETAGRTDLGWRPLASPFLTPIELDHVWWASGSDAVFFLDWDRDRRSVRLVSADPATGECTVLVEERSETPIDLNAVYYGRPNVWVARDRREIIWYSTRSGWGHLYLLDGNGDPIRQLTGGEWVVTDLVRVDEETRTAFFMGAGKEPSRDPYYHHLYAVSLDGGEPVLLTPEDAEHGEWPPWVDFSPEGQYFVDRFSRIDQPPRTVLRRSTGELVAQVAETDVSALLATGWRYPERFTAKASDGETDLWGMIVLPYDFDPARKYPVIESIYPGPQATRTPRAFTDVVGESTRCLADLGFVVFTVDGRGTPGTVQGLSWTPVTAGPGRRESWPITWRRSPNWQRKGRTWTSTGSASTGTRRAATRRSGRCWNTPRCTGWVSPRRETTTRRSPTSPGGNAGSGPFRDPAGTPRPTGPWHTTSEASSSW